MVTFRELADQVKPVFRWIIDHQRFTALLTLAEAASVRPGVALTVQEGPCKLEEMCALARVVHLPYTADFVNLTRIVLEPAYSPSTEHTTSELKQVLSKHRDEKLDAHCNLEFGAAIGAHGEIAELTVRLIIGAFNSSSAEKLVGHGYRVSPSSVVLRLDGSFNPTDLCMIVSGEKRGGEEVHLDVEVGVKPHDSFDSKAGEVASKIAERFASSEAEAGKEVASSLEKVSRVCMDIFKHSALGWSGDFNAMFSQAGSKALLDAVLLMLYP